jgi:phage-related protein (TIGR01555 family)
MEPNMFKFQWPFKSVKNNADEELRQVKEQFAPQYDALDPLSRLGKVRGWDVTEKEPFKLATVDDFLESKLMPAGVMDGALAKSAMDDGDGTMPAAKAANGASNYTVPEQLQNWYNSQSFIGYQSCAIIAQHWLVDKACSMAGEDALRNGWEVKTDGVKLTDEQKAVIADLDIKFKIKENLAEFNRFKNIFGIRIALFEVESEDKDYYSKPFNIDGVIEGSYKGVSQVDPYWMMPMLTNASTADPSAKDFYEPDYWIISGKKYHRSHLIIARGPQPADILKPTYIFGGIPLTQRIYERVYAAERTANEAPLLATNKRTTAIHVDVEKALVNEESFVKRLLFWVKYRDNHAVKVLGKEESMEQFDTNLSDFDSVIMNQYQLVAAIAKTPATKLLGTSPKGFNATGEFEMVSYHEELESIQEHVYDPLLDRHYQLACKSLNFSAQLKVVWNSVDSCTSQQLADLNAKKAETDERNVNMGAISPDEVRQRLRDDPRSGYNRLTDDEAEMEPGMSPENLAELEKAGSEAVEAEAARTASALGATPPTAPTTPKPQAAPIPAPKAKEDAEPAPTKADEIRNLLASLVSKLDDLADATMAEGVDLQHDDAPGLHRTTKPSVKGMEPSVYGQARLVGEKDHSQLHRIKMDGIVSLIENPRGSIRQGKDGSWRVKMPHHYGFIKGTKGADGDEVDCFIGPNLKSKRVFVVNQVGKTGQFDEHKCMLGFDSETDARKGYLGSFSPGWDGLGSIHEIHLNDFRKWLAKGDTSKPFGAIR